MDLLNLGDRILDYVERFPSSRASVAELVPLTTAQDIADELRDLNPDDVRVLAMRVSHGSLCTAAMALRYELFRLASEKHTTPQPV